MPVTNLVIDVQHQLNHQHTDGKIQHRDLKIFNHYYKCCNLFSLQLLYEVENTFYSIKILNHDN